MNVSGPVERVTVARYDDDYPLTWGAGSQQTGAVDARRDDEAPALAAGALGPPPSVIQVDLLDGWLKP